MSLASAVVDNRILGIAVGRALAVARLPDPLHLANELDGIDAKLHLVLLGTHAILLLLAGN